LREAAHFLFYRDKTAAVASWFFNPHAFPKRGFDLNPVPCLENVFAPDELEGSTGQQAFSLPQQLARCFRV
jgi:hypothetical protein